MTNSKEAAVKQFLALFHATELDIGAIRAALADDARWQPIVPLAETVHGADAVCREAERQYKLYADCDCQLLHIASAGIRCSPSASTAFACCTTIGRS